MYDLEKEKREAVKAGERALASLKSAKSKLDEAKSWGVVDILGGGIVSSLIKRSKMDDANAYMEQAKRDLARFGKELRDVEDFKDLGIKNRRLFLLCRLVHGQHLCRFCHAGQDKQREGSGEQSHRPCRKCSQPIKSKII